MARDYGHHSMDMEAQRERQRTPDFSKRPGSSVRLFLVRSNAVFIVMISSSVADDYEKLNISYISFTLQLIRNNFSGIVSG